MKIVSDLFVAHEEDWEMPPRLFDGIPEDRFENSLRCRLSIRSWSLSKSPMSATTCLKGYYN